MRFSGLGWMGASCRRFQIAFWRWIPERRSAARRSILDPRSDRDALIAATALVHDMTAVTRNVSHFQVTGVAVFNPVGTLSSDLAQVRLALVAYSEYCICLPLLL